MERQNTLKVQSLIQFVQSAGIPETVADIDSVVLQDCWTM
jgi:hypothetical protein